MNWMILQTAQNSAPAAVRPDRPREEKAQGAERGSFRDMLQQKQEGAQTEEPQEAVQQPQPDPDAPVEIPDQQRVLAAALVMQAIVPTVETPVDVQPEQAPVDLVVGTDTAAGVEPVAVQPRTEQRPPEAVVEQGYETAVEAPNTPQESVPVRQTETRAEPEAVTDVGPEQKPAVGEKLGEQPEDKGKGADPDPSGSEPGFLFPKAGDVVVKVGEPAALDTQDVNFEAQLAKQAVQAQEKGWQHVEIKLEPEHLGTLTLTLDKSQDGTLHITLNAASEKTANLLSEHTTGLGALLQGSNQGQQVTVEVQRQQESQQSQDQQQYQNQDRGGGQQGQQQERRQPHGDARDFMQQLRLGLVTLDDVAS